MSIHRMNIRRFLAACAVSILLCIVIPSCRKASDVAEEQNDVAETGVIDADLVLLADSVQQGLYAMQLSNGLLETSSASNLVSLYDNALAALVFLQSGNFESAEAILTYFNNRVQTELLTGNGGFFQFRNSQGQPQGNRWLGDNAWLLIAIHNYEDVTGDFQYGEMRDALETWIRAQQDASGGVNGGTDAGGAVIGKVTEGMIDAFTAVRGFDSFHEGILTYLEQERWDTTDQLMVSWPGSDYYYALDNFSWGYCTFEGFPDRVLDEADRFLNTQVHTPSQQTIEGYCFDEDRDVVWLEGTSQMAIAYLKAGNGARANSILHEVAKTRIAFSTNGTVGIPYATNQGTGYGGGMLWSGVDTQPATAASCWFVMACHEFDPMQLNYGKGIPDSFRFW